MLGKQSRTHSVIQNEQSVDLLVTCHQDDTAGVVHACQGMRSIGHGSLWAVWILTKAELEVRDTGCPFRLA